MSDIEISLGEIKGYIYGLFCYVEFQDKENDVKVNNIDYKYKFNNTDPKTHIIFYKEGLEPVPKDTDLTNKYPDNFAISLDNVVILKDNTKIQFRVISDYVNSITKEEPKIKEPNTITIDNFEFKILYKIEKTDTYEKNEIVIESKNKDTQKKTKFIVYRSDSELGTWRLGLKKGTDTKGTYVKPGDYVTGSFIHIELQEFINKNINIIPITELKGDDTNLCMNETYINRRKDEKCNDPILTELDVFCNTINSKCGLGANFKLLNTNVFPVTVNNEVNNKINEFKTNHDITSDYETIKQETNILDDYLYIIDIIHKYLIKKFTIIKNNDDISSKKIYDYEFIINNIKFINNIYELDIKADNIFYKYYYVKYTIDNIDSFKGTYYYPYFFIPINSSINDFGNYDCYINSCFYFCKPIEYALQLNIVNLYTVNFRKIHSKYLFIGDLISSYTFGISDEDKLKAKETAAKIKEKEDIIIKTEQQKADAKEVKLTEKLEKKKKEAVKLKKLENNKDKSIVMIGSNYNYLSTITEKLDLFSFIFNKDNKDDIEADFNKIPEDVYFLFITSGTASWIKDDNGNSSLPDYFNKNPKNWLYNDDTYIPQNIKDLSKNKIKIYIGSGNSFEFYWNYHEDININIFIKGTYPNKTFSESAIFIAENKDLLEKYYDRLMLYIYLELLRNPGKSLDKIEFNQEILDKFELKDKKTPYKIIEQENLYYPLDLMDYQSFKSNANMQHLPLLSVTKDYIEYNNINEINISEKAKQKIIDNYIVRYY